MFLFCTHLIKNWLHYFDDQFSLLTSYLLVYILLAYWLFISTYKEH